ncbi:MAG: hypothetical protein JO058_19720 [Alphaproteobacteria bacterium]|nr:hypothetical protein [Alphaproteobacteria bacterium]
MRFDIEFFRWKAPGVSDVVRRRTGQFASLNDAKTFGLANMGVPGSPEEVDGFRVVESGVTRSEVIIHHRPRNA